MSCSGNLKDIEARHIEEILGALRKPAGKQIILPEGLIFGIEYDRYLLGFNPEEIIPFPQLPGDLISMYPANTRLPDWTIEARLLRAKSCRKTWFQVETDRFMRLF